MSKSEAITGLNRLLLREKGLVDARNKTPEAHGLKESRKKLSTQLREIGKSGDLGIMLSAERRLLENDLAEYANSGAMATSLKKALVELQAAEKSLPLVRDPALYRAVDDSHGHPKSRTGGLPKDAPRQFFSSHAARLLNWDKSRLDDEEKKIIDQRKTNMRTAGKLYAEMQRQALGIEVKPAKGRDQGMEM